MILGIALDGASAVTADYYVKLAQLAERGRFDFLAIDDSFAPGRRLDALLVAARIGPVTQHIGLLPTVTTTHTEPFHVSKSLATLDYVSRGRAGWNVDVSRTAAEAAHFGRKSAAPPEKLWAEASDAVDVVRRLWDSWEDDAEIRDAATGRFIDREKLHYVDFAGEFFSVRGPSITPRPPQGHPVIAIRVDEPEAVPVAARWADIVRSAAKDIAEAADIRRNVRAEIAANGRDPDQVAFLVDVSVAETEELAGRLEEWQSSVDGFTLYAADLETIVDVTIPDLTRRGLRPETYAPGSFRERLGLSRPENQYAEAK
jgi:alkanesulfonate monooxygenase SsuD/methylene tetrahydromethanopterin reductase-like flavin-dependent oxidoreductase (luciferase family)